MYNKNIISYSSNTGTRRILSLKTVTNLCYSSLNNFSNITSIKKTIIHDMLIISNWVQLVDYRVSSDFLNFQQTPCRLELNSYYFCEIIKSSWNHFFFSVFNSRRWRITLSCECCRMVLSGTVLLGVNRVSGEKVCVKHCCIYCPHWSDNCNSVLIFALTVVAVDEVRVECCSPSDSMNVISCRI